MELEGTVRLEGHHILRLLVVCTTPNAQAEMGLMGSLHPIFRLV
jgi:hypothetical protein